MDDNDDNDERTIPRMPTTRGQPTLKRTLHATVPFFRAAQFNHMYLDEVWTLDPGKTKDF